jgi:lysylphosphatidylglycerol synthetase-like protein (DUF2156 family)
MTNPPPTVRSTRFLILFNALLWLGFGIITAAGAHPSYREPGILRWAMAISALLAAGLLLALVRPLARRKHTAYRAAVVLLAAISAAAVFDDFGLADLAFLIITLLPLALLLKDRKWYLEPINSPANGKRTA